MISFSTARDMGNIDRITAKDISYKGDVLGQAHVLSALTPTEFLSLNGGKIDFIFYYALMWDIKLKNLDKKSALFLAEDKILVSNSVLHLCCIQLFFHRLALETQILNNKAAFDNVYKRIRTEQSFNKIDKFVSGYNFKDGFLVDLEDSHKKVQYTDIEEEPKVSHESIELIVKANKSAPIEVRSINDIQETYCKDQTDLGHCCNDKCSIFKNYLCSLNFDANMSSSIYVDAYTITMDEITDFY